MTAVFWTFLALGYILAALGWVAFFGSEDQRRAADRRIRDLADRLAGQRALVAAYRGANERLVRYIRDTREEVEVTADYYEPTPLFFSTDDRAALAWLDEQTEWAE